MYDLLDKKIYGQGQNTCALGNPTLPKFTGET